MQVCICTRVCMSMCMCICTTGRAIEKLLRSYSGDASKLLDICRYVHVHVHVSVRVYVPQALQLRSCRGCLWQWCRYTYIHTCIHTYIHTYIYTYIWWWWIPPYAGVHTCIHTCICVIRGAEDLVHTMLDKCMYVHMHVCMHFKHVCTCIRI